MVRSPRSCEGTPLKAAPTVVCARTSLAVAASNDAREAPCVRATASRHIVWASSMARGTRAARRPRAARTAGWRRSRGRARMKAGDACASLQAPRLGSGNAQCSGWRDGPRRFDGDARRKHAHGQSRRSATLTLLDVPLHVWRGAVRCYGRVAPSRPEQRNNVARSSEGQPFTTGMNAWPGLWRLVQVPTWRPAVLHRRERRRLLSTVA